MRSSAATGSWCHRRDHFHHHCLPGHDRLYLLEPVAKQTNKQTKVPPFRYSGHSELYNCNDGRTRKERTCQKKPTNWVVHILQTKEDLTHLLLSRFPTQQKPHLCLQVTKTAMAHSFLWQAGQGSQLQILVNSTSDLSRTKMWEDEREAPAL